MQQQQQQPRTFPVVETPSFLIGCADKETERERVCFWPSTVADARGRVGGRHQQPRQRRAWEERRCEKGRPHTRGGERRPIFLLRIFFFFLPVFLCAFSFVTSKLPGGGEKKDTQKSHHSLKKREYYTKKINFFCKKKGLLKKIKKDYWKLLFFEIF